jgi:uncharacterized RmlC-like cupin family protein
VKKDNGTDVNYYIFDEYEIHLNTIAPGSVQEWHYHTKIEESILVIKGKLYCKWIEDDMEKSRYIYPGELVRVMKSVHTFENDTDEPVEFTVFRFAPTGENKRELIKNDKVIVES